MKNHQLVIAQESGDALIPPMSGELEGDMQMICSETQQWRKGREMMIVLHVFFLFRCCFCFYVFPNLRGLTKMLKGKYNW